MILPARLMKLHAETALMRMEQVEEYLAEYADTLPSDPLEHAALTQRVDAATGELRWIHNQIAKLAVEVDKE